MPWSDVDVFIAADRAAWEDRPLHTLPPGARVAPGSADGQRSIELINQLSSLRKPTRSPSQLVHGDLYGTVLFAGTTAPGITDISNHRLADRSEWDRVNAKITQGWEATTRCAA